ncbi:MAG: SNF2-related protein [Chloroflexota bacterium]
MTTEHLEWLDLSPPPAPAPKKPVEAGAAACPTCGWPLPAAAGRCPTCGHAAGRKAAVDLLARLKVDLPAPLIEVSPPPDHWFKDEEFDSPAMYGLRLQAEQLRVTGGFDRLICLDDISVDHYQHQLEAALRALRDLRGRALLADEVGLGKTIEAGIVMKELIERGLANSVLIITPASITWQWHEEMDAKFHEQFVVLERPKQLSPSPTELPSAACRWLISLDRAKSAGWAKKLLAREYDLLIVDEAHKLKNHRTDSYRFVNQIRTRYVLMLTATPVHNDLLELYNLITILRPGHLGTRRAFRQNFVARAEPSASNRRLPARRTVYSQSSPSDYLAKSRPKRQEYRQDQARSRWILQRTEDSARLDRLENLTPAGQKAVAEVNALLAQGYEIFDFEAIEYKRYGLLRRSLCTDFVCRLKLKAQPGRSPQSRPRSTRRTLPRNPAAQRSLLREVMIRNRRSSVGVRFPPRKAAIYAVEFDAPERELYDGVTAYIRRQLALLQPESDPAPAPRRIALLALQKQLCSSPQSAARSLHKLVEGQDDSSLAGFLALARSIEQGRKVRVTLNILDQYPGKFLIFTDYVPTLHALQRALTQAGHETVVFHGGLSAAAGVEAVRSFRKSARVMISTRSGGEGHNLQFCHQLINFDLPWNPMRIEQRVGRLHRLGQKEPVTIFNLAAADTIEAYVLDLLARKIRMFELVIGELDLILGELYERRGFEGYIEEAWANSQSETELRQMLAQLELLLGQAQTTYEEIRAASDELSDLIDAHDADLR